ncbi:Hypothetical protein FKW44_005732 [Caligus rogercresseyi]|uniref:Uncharacterized protein n=1 Tax=Caligus rogercresseyi TaxID=217165 RepID=A0A7T8KCC1_CALRO|nr:Hypothetical protein FKW44_005732 [Caligus rogercresseyi]
MYSDSPKTLLSSEKQRRTSHFLHWVLVYLYCSVCSVLSSPSLGNVQFGPCAHPAGGCTCFLGRGTVWTPITWGWSLHHNIT